MKTVTEKIKLANGSEITIKKNEFTDEELAKMPERHRKAILSMRGFTDDILRREN